MTNIEIIEKYGEEKGREIIEKRQAASRKWHAEHKDYYRKYIEEHRQQWNGYARKYQSKHRQEQRDRLQDYHDKPEGRAVNLLTSYRQFDTRRFGEAPQLTRFDIITKCFSDNSRCVYCGETTWTELGLDRITNEKPHSTFNTVPCCKKCNNKRNRKTFDEFLVYLGLTLEEWMEKNNAVFSDELKIC